MSQYARSGLKRINASTADALTVKCRTM